MTKRNKKTDTPLQAAARQMAREAKPQSIEEASDMLKAMFGPIIEEMLQAELDNHLGYETGTHDEKSTNNRRNGYSNKTLKSSYGEVPIQIPRDRQGTFEPGVVPKHSRDISEIENKVLSMYASGMSQRDISGIIEEIYGFSMSAETISKITDRVYPLVDEWRNRPLKSCYPFLFVDCLYVPVKTDTGVVEKAVYVILGYDAEGYKDILGIWIGEAESKHYWMQTFDELKARGVKDVFFISMDGVSGLESGAKAIFPGVVVQRCIVHLIRNSLRYISTRDRAAFCRDLKKVYGAINLTVAESAFEEFRNNWKHCPGAVAVWESNYIHVQQLFNYPSDIRKVMYTTNAIESVNSSLRKVIKKGAMPSDDAVYKALYLRIQTLTKKWTNHKKAGWTKILNQLMCDEQIAPRLSIYLQ